MPRYVRYKPDQKIDQAEYDRKTKTFQVKGYKKWVDPFPSVHGTRPEKMVYEQLVRRGIKFYFLNEFTYSIPEIELAKEYQTDFVLPDQKIIIEVQGSYWHSQPDAVESDAFKFAVYQQAGWRALAWWDFDIEADVNKLFREEPLLAGYNFIPTNANTELAVVSRKNQNTSKGIVTMNKRRALRLSYRKKPVTIKKTKVKGLRGYATGIK